MSERWRSTDPKLARSSTGAQTGACPAQPALPETLRPVEEFARPDAFGIAWQLVHDRSVRHHYSMEKDSLSIKGGVMKQNLAACGWWRTFGYAVGVSLVLSPGLSWGLEIDKAPPMERQETISLADAAIRALQHNLDINISRQTKESRQADITVEQAKFDPTLSVNGQYNRIVNPLNRPVFGATD